MFGVQIRTNAAHARLLSGLLSPTRSFVGVARGTFVMEAADEVQALRDFDFLTSQRLLDPSRVTLVDGDLS